MICSCGNKGTQHVYNTFSYWYCNKCNVEIKQDDDVDLSIFNEDMGSPSWIQLGLWDDL